MYLWIFLGAIVFWAIQQKASERRMLKRFKWSNAESKARARALVVSHPGAYAFEVLFRAAWTTAGIFVAVGISNYLVH